MRNIALALLATALLATGCGREDETLALPENESAPVAAPDIATSGGTAVQAECRPASDDCPVHEDKDVTTTDSLPLGSTIRRSEDGQTIGESDYPTSPGSGSAGSGITGTPTGPAPGPATGIGR